MSEPLFGVYGKSPKPRHEQTTRVQNGQFLTGKEHSSNERRQAEDPIEGWMVSLLCDSKRSVCMYLEYFRATFPILLLFFFLYRKLYHA